MWPTFIFDRQHVASSMAHVRQAGPKVRHACHHLLFTVAVLSFGAPLAADEKIPEPSAEAVRFFEAKIRPVLVEQCYRCHSADGQGIRGGLAVDSRDALLAGGESGPAIVPGNLDDSLLWNAINHRDFSMPPKQKLPPEVIADFRTWIEMGAPDPRVAETTVVKSRVSEEDIQAGRQFWAFKTPVMPVIPPQSDWARTNIDRLIEKTFADHQLKPASDTDAFTLLRRLHLDLVGLPPAPEEATRFASSWKQNPEDAISSEVERLLESAQFGERWGRHWLDVARYAESSGKEVDMSYPHAWRYRDYVINAFNADKPYDRFVQEQIAGDLLPAKNDEEWAQNLIATSFLALGPKALIEQNPRQFQADLIDEQIDVVTRVVLGVSVACARCHDHKFDPIPQTDYYALAGIFQSTETFYGGFRSQRNRQPSNLIILPIDDPNAGDEPLSKSQIAELTEQRDQARKDYTEARRLARQPATQGKPGDTRRPLLNAALLDRTIAQLTNRINSVDENGQPLTFCMGVQTAEKPKNARVLIRGEIDQPAQEVEKGFVTVLSSSPAKIAPDSTGRLELARWMTGKDNPLTARVMVNRIWMHLLGEAIVRETENFGASGPGATHPELLDYLAVRFMEQNWSVKSVIREIANSRVYRLSSRFDAERFEKDPDNLYFARANARRLDAETIRDGMLAASGQLDLKRPRGSMISDFGTTLIGPNGPVVLPPLASTSAGPSDSNKRPGQNRNNSMAGKLMSMARNAGRSASGNLFDAPVYYRSVYLPVARNNLPRSLEVFDFAEPSMVIGQREQSNTPAQALYMLNNPFVTEQSDALARRILREASTPEDRIALAFQLVCSRPVQDEELKASVRFLKTADAESAEEVSNNIQGKSRRARTERRSKEEEMFLVFSEFCQALFASAEFRYVN